MRRMTTPLIVALSVAGLAACGSSSKSSSTTTTTTSASGSTTASASGGSSVPITSATFRAVLLHDLRYGSHPLSLAEAQKAADCGIKKFLSQGIKTYADFTNPKNAQIEHQDGIECARQTGYRK